MHPLEQLAQLARQLPPQFGAQVERITRELEGERGALKALQAIGLKLTKVRDAFDVLTLFQDVLEEAVHLMNAGRTALALIADGELRVVDSRGRDGDDEVQVSKMLLERVVATQQPIITTNVQEDPTLNLQASASILALDIRSVLAVPLRSRNEVIGVLYADTQFIERVFSERDAAVLETFASQVGVAVMQARALQEEHESFVTLVRVMLSTLDKRDPYTAGHSERVGLYTQALARKLGWNAADQERALFAGRVHDIGKIGIRDNFLDKAGPLTPEERRVLEQHTVIGADIIHQSGKRLEAILTAVRSHHERWDGRGYPDGMSGAAIPLLARMVGIADTFDAVTTARPYSDPKTWTQAFDILRSVVGTQFDPELVEPFITALQESQITTEVERINRSGEIEALSTD
ncbi:MAG: HD domain-containing protein [Pleurocapsa sp. SU_196_0]|nr:HD domain-containing protein [Pleurocapsa sp. SU_196_0]